MPSFKVPCPSCEAQVLIKNPNLIGTKVECPKCKYRFKVEEPAAEGAADDKAKKKDKDAAKPKKKGKSKAGGIVAVVAAVAVLAVVGYFVVGKKKPETTGTKGGGVRPNITNTGGTGGTGGTDEGGDQKKDEKDKDGKEKKPKPVYTLPTSDKDPTNLLPGQSVAVYRFNMEQVSQNPTFRGLFDANADLFKTSMGFELDNVATYFHCVVGADRGSFGVLRLTAPVAARETAAKMSLEPGPKVFKDNRALHTIKSNPFVTAVGQTLAARSVLGDVYETMPGKPESPPKPAGVCFYDTQTILVGDLAVVDQFLTGLKADGYPEFKSVLAAADVKAGKAELTTSPSYRTIDLALKRNLNAVDAEADNPPMIVFAELLAPNEYDPKLFKKHLKPIGDVLDPVLRRARSVGMNLTSFTAQNFTATVRIVTDSDSEARVVANEHLTPGLTAALPPLSLFFGTNIELRNGLQPTTPGTGTIPGPMGAGGQPYPGSSDDPDGPPRGSSPAGPPRGGSAAGPPRGGSAAGPPRGGSGMQPPLAGPGGMQPPMVGPGGEGTQGGTTAQPTPTATNSFVDLKTTDNVVTVTVTVFWSDTTYRRILAPRLASLGNQTKGKMAVYAASYGFFPLAEAVKGYTEKYKSFPRGVSDRPVHAGVGLPYPPSKRVSFFSELLPFMERSKSLSGPDRGLGWAEEKVLNTGRIDKQGDTATAVEVQSNIPAAELWVPELLVPYYPATAWRATSPLAPDKIFGGTNFVAIAGVGVEAARLDPNDPAAAKKAGITGYAWGSKVDDVTDGLANTIYLMQVPPGLSRPWAAGGGATVMGLNEKDPMADFVHTRPDGEKGAYAIMGDGAVRWISAKIDPKHFLAMATRAGGETLPPIDTIAPKIELKKADAPNAAVAADPMPPAVGKLPATPDTAPAEVAPPPRAKSRD